MAAITEDSVVAALAEVRQVAEDRKRRDQQARREAEERKRRELQARRDAEWRDRDAEAPRMSGAMDTGRGLAAAPGAGGFFEGVDGPQYDPQHGRGYNPRSNGWAVPAVVPFDRPEALTGVADRLRPRSSVGPVLLTALLLVGAGAFGYQQLDKRFQAVLDAKNQQIVAAQTALSGAQREAELISARAAGDAKQAIVACDGRVREAVVQERKAQAALMPAFEPEAPTTSRTGSGRSQRSKREDASSKKVAQDKASSDKADKGDSPRAKVAKRRKFSDDPLGGLSL